MSPAASPEQALPVLATLRDDLKLLEGPPQENGSPTWTIHDPVRNLFFRIGRQEFAMLNYWKIRNVTRLQEIINRTTTLVITIQDILFLNDFLINNLLVVPDTEEALARLKARLPAKKPGILLGILKNYLFFRIPLVRPDRFLAATLPFARFLAGKFFLTFLFIIGIAGVLLALRQWETFLHTFLYFFSPQGLLYYGAAIFFSKLLHELGHAYTAKHYGLHVPTMGVAFLVMWPVLYSDNSEAWRIKSRTSRVKIVAAGILVEMALALIATFLWSFLSDGPLKSACFVTATVTWMSSFFINLSPFLRFDGYYLLSDLWEMPNLHARAFLLAKRHMRKILLGISGPIPENLPKKKIRLLILFAYITWIYRLILFTGIALLVYNFFFKALGVFLFSLEIVCFVILPIYRELAFWWKKREEIGMNRRLVLTFFALAVLPVLLFVPLNTRIQVPGLIKPGIPYRIYPHFSARLKKITIADGSHVHKGDLLFEFDSPYLDNTIKSLQIRVAMLTMQLNRISQESEFIEQQQILHKKLIGSRTELDGYLKQQQQLKITAPADGIIKDLADDLTPGYWVNSKQFLGVLVKTDEVLIEGYPDENELARISRNNPARFYAENGDLSPFACKVEEINLVNSRTLEEPYLASVYGGTLPVRVSKDKLISDKSLYRILLLPARDQIELPGQIRRGIIVIQGRPESLAFRFTRNIMAVIIRESGF